ncbi:hypothetical protein [Flammeovirga kamogawensis]|uniref:Uncharacterized protein n=1 Tax=Flammeovirga kamogawensis TaxID=373891 RepID=A0ABX8GV72_9BACT|nr:hypothetical protein [Flammeovirga kamogawensis]MBB6461584.1 hypothetical protein [Flammeovirga kamogawensis]QWG07485.1 hypothetical protein KM029_00695 [Flammeovirga kamogawensis]TRX69298.1 hypothetical protein EO216_14640 [Flammeovirga kamogawensis]
MMNFTKIVLLLLLYSFTACETETTYTPGETFVKFYGTESAETGVDILSISNGFLLLGNTNSTTSTAAFLVETDLFGNEKRQYIVSDTSANNTDNAVGMVKLSENNVVILANRNDSLGVLMYVDPQSENRGTTSVTEIHPGYDQVVFNAIESTSDGGVIIIGEVRNTSPGAGVEPQWDMISIKYTSTGALEWEKIQGFQPTANDLGNSVVEGDNQNYYLFGAVDIKKVNDDNEEFISSDMRTVRVNSVGDIVWDKYFGSSSNELGIKISSYANTLYVLGDRQVSETNRDILFSSLDENGDAGVLQEFGLSGIDRGRDMALTNDGVYIVGSTDSDGIDEDILLMKISYTGEIFWQKTIGYEGPDYGRKVIVQNDKSILVVGTANFGNNTKICFIKTDPNGSLSYQQTLTTTE